MKESYSEGLANHTGPESCAGVRKSAGEALTGVRAGRVLSCEINAPPRGGLLRGADALENVGRPYLMRRDGETHRGPARSKTPYMHGDTLFGNREIPSVCVVVSTARRIEKPQGIRR